MFPARINNRIRNDVAAECEQNNKACQQTESRYPEQTHYSDLLQSLPRSVKPRRLFIEVWNGCITGEFRTKNRHHLRSISTQVTRPQSCARDSPSPNSVF